MRRCAWRIAAKDRLDLAYAAKELARDLKEPRKRNWRRFKRAGRYLPGTLDLYQEMLNKPNQDLTMDIFVDSDWGGVTLETIYEKVLVGVLSMWLACRLVSSAGHKNNEL